MYHFKFSQFFTCLCSMFMLCVFLLLTRVQYCRLTFYVASPSIARDIPLKNMFYFVLHLFLVAECLAIFRRVNERFPPDCRVLSA